MGFRVYDFSYGCKVNKGSGAGNMIRVQNDMINDVVT